MPSVTTLRLVPPGLLTPQPGVAPWLAPASGPGLLAPGSDPSVLPADVLIADHHNNRLVIVDPQGRIRWEFPRSGDLAPGQIFLQPDDAFFSPDGKYIIVTQEDDYVISVISMATSKIVYRYGVPGVPGSGPNHLFNPDDAMLTPGGLIVSADIKNCRVVIIAPPAHTVLRVIGQTTNACLHDPPHRFGSPNGAFPLTDGNYLVTEINGDWADEMSLTGVVSWAVHPPGVAYPSDTNEVYPGRYLTADYSNPGQIAEFTSAGRCCGGSAGSTSRRWPCRCRTVTSCSTTTSTTGCALSTQSPIASSGSTATPATPGPQTAISTTRTAWTWRLPTRC